MAKKEGGTEADDDGSFPRGVSPAADTKRGSVRHNINRSLKSEKRFKRRKLQMQKAAHPSGLCFTDKCHYSDDFDGKSLRISTFEVLRLMLSY
nr:hypothetical protein HAGR004_17790 [Bdellovibrio sp. HAGR004]